ncbi:hypothetical protein HDV00_000527 [Rhizophlyctis rosea]|nr:hypothetical protein HDV00_000527 [Rhizophlyctis rosea]
MQATKRATTLEAWPLTEDGRLELRDLKLHKGWLEVYWLPKGPAGPAVLMLVDEKGNSTKKFDHEGNYEVKFMPRPTHSESVSFSSAEIIDVYQNFRLVDAEPWHIQAQNRCEMTPALTEIISLLHKYHNFHAGSACRELITVMLLSALKTVSPHLHPGKPLVVDNDVSIQVTKEVTNSDGETILKTYTGSIDIVVGHSHVGNKIANDVSTLIIEAKKDQSNTKALAQTLAQAATCLLIRKQKMKDHGFGTPCAAVMFATVDGERWRFGRMVEKGTTISVSWAKEIRCSIEKLTDGPQIEEIFKVLCQVLVEGCALTSLACGSGSSVGGGRTSR